MIKLSAIVLAVTFAAAQTALAATPWIDIDDPSGKGDYEQINVECKIKGTNEIVTDGKVNGVAAPGYYCQAPRGGWCVNAETVPANSCRDMEVRWSNGPYGL
jgi:hypothetical protein